MKLVITPGDGSFVNCCLVFVCTHSAGTNKNTEHANGILDLMFTKLQGLIHIRPVGQDWKNALTMHRKDNFIFSAELKCGTDCIFAQHDAKCYNASQCAVIQRVEFNVILWHFSKVIKQEKSNISGHTLYRTCCPALVWMGPKTLYNHLPPNHVPSTLFHFNRLYRMAEAAGIIPVMFFRANGRLSCNSNRSG